MDFAALAVRGPKCWIAGTPGSRVLHSPDGGRTWTHLPHAHVAAAGRLCFPDDRHGWAVGAMGTILASDDGGRTWRRQRAGGATGRPAGPVLPRGRRPAGTAGAAGRRRRLPERRRRARPPRRRDRRRATRPIAAIASHEAVVVRRRLRRRNRLAVSPAAGRLAPFRAAKSSTVGTASTAAAACEDLEAHLVRQIRLWRPEVVVTQCGRPSRRRCGRAVDRPGRGRGHPQGGRPAARFRRRRRWPGLEPWQVKKAYGTAAVGEPRRDGRDRPASRRRGWAARWPTWRRPPAACWRTTFSRRAAALAFGRWPRRGRAGQGGGDLFAGIALRPGGEARRPVDRGLGRKRRTAPADGAAAPPYPGHSRPGRPRPAGRRAAAGADRRSDPRPGRRQRRRRSSIGWPTATRQTGHGDMAAETFQLLVDQYPDDPLCRPALIWLVQYYASGEEAERAHAALSGRAVSEARRPLAAGGGVGNANRADAARSVRPSGGAFSGGRRLSQPGLLQQAQRSTPPKAAAPTATPGGHCAAANSGCCSPKVRRPSRCLSCVTAAGASRDWTAGWTTPFGSGPSRSPCTAACTTIRSGRPRSCSPTTPSSSTSPFVAARPPGRATKRAAGPRPRDADLSAHDRVDVLIDLDRDFATYYRLTIDHRGWTNDSCCGDSTWDPTWYVAARTATRGAGPPRRPFRCGQLTSRRPAAETVWAIGVQRTVPGVGFQSWTTPAAATVVPEGFGYLIFK